MLGLVIKSPWIDLILSQQKAWEIRGSKTNVRGAIALIKSGSGKIYGTCNVVDCVGPLSLDELRANADKHQIPLESLEALTYAKTYAWVLSDAKPLPDPVAYKHPSGAVIWVKLPELPTL